MRCGGVGSDGVRPALVRRWPALDGVGRWRRQHQRLVLAEEWPRHARLREEQRAEPSRAVAAEIAARRGDHGAASEAGRADHGLASEAREHG